MRPRIRAFAFPIRKRTFLPEYLLRYKKRGTRKSGGFNPPEIDEERVWTKSMKKEYEKKV
jgi:hypothetical protein